MRHKILILFFAGLLANCSKKQISGPVVNGVSKFQLSGGSAVSQSGTEEYNPYVVRMPDGFLALVFASDRACASCSGHNLFVARSTAAYNNDAVFPAFASPVVFTVAGTPLNIAAQISFAATVNGANMRIYLTNAGGNIQFADISPTGSYNVAALSAITNTTWQAATVTGIDSAGTTIYIKKNGSLYAVDPAANTPLLTAMITGQSASSLVNVNAAFTARADGFFALSGGSITAMSPYGNGGNLESVNKAVAKAKISARHFSILQTGVRKGELMFISGIEPGSSTQDMYVVDGLDVPDMWDLISPKPPGAPGSSGGSGSGGSGGTTPVATAQWGATTTSGTAIAYFNAVARDTSGNLIAVGVQNTPGNHTYGAGVTATGYGVVVVKYNSSGVAQWARTVTAGCNCDFKSVAVDSFDNIYAVGYQWGTSTVTYAAGVTATGVNTAFNVLIVKYDDLGNALWARTVTTGSNASEFSGVTVDSSGNIFAVGYQYGNSTYTYNTGITAAGSAPANNNVILVKYGATGAAQWVRTLTAGSGGAQFYAVATDTSGNIYTAGIQNGTGTYTYAGAASAVGTYTSANASLVKFNSAGTAQWAKSVTAGTNQSTFRAIAVDTSANVYAAGDQAGTGSYTYGTGVSVAGTAGTNGLIVKYDAAGTAQWARSTTSGTQPGQFNAVATNSSGNVFIGGQQDNTGSNTYGSGVSVAGVAAGCKSVLLLKYDAAGIIQGGQSVTAGTYHSYFYGIVVDASNNIFAAGRQDTTGNFTYGTGVTIAGQSNINNPALVKYN